MTMDRKVENIKYVRLTSTGEVKPTKEVPIGEKVTCPKCGIPGTICASTLGNPFFRRNPGKEHTDPDCSALIAPTEDVKMHGVLAKTNGHRLIRNLLRPGVPAEEIENENEREGGDIPRGKAPRRLGAYTTLKQLYEDGVCFLPPDTPMAAGTVGEVFAASKETIKEIIADPLYNGDRVIMAAVDPIRHEQVENMNPCRPCLQFVVFARGGDGSYQRKYILLECEDAALIQPLMELLYTPTVDENGRRYYEPRCTRVLIAGHWDIAGCDKCVRSCMRRDGEKRPRDCRGAIVARYTSRRQVYGIVSDKTKSAEEHIETDKHDAL